jgi:osmotically-inducible protein OsmY
MRVRHALGALAISSLLTCVGIAPASAQQESTPAPDNTKVNKGNQPTADQGKNNATDRDLMQKIRKAIVDDANLSSYAHNIKVIAQNGKVTLKGPVRSEEEKVTVEQKAAEIAGASNVTNELTVKAARSKKG